MTFMTKMLAGAAGIAALAAATPAAAQYYQQYGYAQQPYGYGYSQPYGYGNPYAAQSTSMATQQCAAAVQNRLANRSGVSGILGAFLGANTAQGRVLSFTQVTPNRSTVRVRGLASSGRMANYGPYGAYGYGALAGGYQADLSFKCDVDYRGYIRDVDIYRR